MDKSIFEKIENYMKENCGESVHDEEHIYRVLYNALDIAENEDNVNFDILITSCLLHDIGRPAQLIDSNIDHAEYGSTMAYNWLIDNGFDVDFSKQVADCILCHRYRGSNIPKTIEAKILFDADKIDAAGLIGIARTLEYKGVINEPIYTSENKTVQDGRDKANQSFFTEYMFKLSKVYDKFLTKRGKEIALKRKTEAEYFYNNLYGYLNDLYINGNQMLEKYCNIK
ncbi:MAG: HD domain-containing protein [Eubacterium sp.]